MGSESTCDMEACDNQAQEGEKYCSDLCEIAAAKSVLVKLLQTAPKDKLYKRRKPGEKQRYLSKLKQTIAEREAKKVLIRSLEAKQRFIDYCIERVKTIRSKDAGVKRLCGFDSRIMSCTDFEQLLAVDTEQSQDKKLADDTLNSQADESTDRVTNMEIDVENVDADSPKDDAKSVVSILPTMCSTNASCPSHDGWEYTKAEEVQLELEDAIKWYLVHKEI